MQRDAGIIQQNSNSAIDVYTIISIITRCTSLHICEGKHSLYDNRKEVSIIFRGGEIHIA